MSKWIKYIYVRLVIIIIIQNVIKANSNKLETLSKNKNVLKKSVVTIICFVVNKFTELSVFVNNNPCTRNNLFILKNIPKWNLICCLKCKNNFDMEVKNIK